MNVEIKTLELVRKNQLRQAKKLKELAFETGKLIQVTEILIAEARAEEGAENTPEALPASDNVVDLADYLFQAE